jgi:hypothetical protein
MPQLQYPTLKMADGMVHKTLTAFNTSHGTNLNKYQQILPTSGMTAGERKMMTTRKLSAYAY